MRFVLGGSDTEMKHIERMLKDLDYEVVKATLNDVRVARGQAYHADWPIPSWEMCGLSASTKTTPRKRWHL